MHTLKFVVGFTVVSLINLTNGIGFYADSDLSTYNLKCDNKQSTRNKSGISRDSQVEGLFLNYTEYNNCPDKTAEQCNRNGIKGYK